jgi:hypothetical protein
MTFGSASPDIRPSTQASPPLAANGSAKINLSQKTTSTSPPLSKPYSRRDITPEPLYGQLPGQPNLLPPFATFPSPNERPRPRSVNSNDRPPPLHHQRSPRAMEAAQSMATMPQRRHFYQLGPYPSPIEPTSDSSGKTIASSITSGAAKVMPPPYPLSSSARNSENDMSPDRPIKRVRLSPREELQQEHLIRHERASSYGAVETTHVSRPFFKPLTPNLKSIPMNNPMTPAASSTNSDDTRQPWRMASNPQIMQERGVRRVSVSSLLSGSPELEHVRPVYAETVLPSDSSSLKSPPIGYDSPLLRRANSNADTENYGLDRGLPDLDTRNNDTAAISGVTFNDHSDLDAWLESVDPGVNEFGFGLQKREQVFAKGGYYASPVPIKIPRNLEPLPSTLLENPMNLLYFHHFLNHTARILVVHDCSQNPFRTILPQSKHIASN